MRNNSSSLEDVTTYTQIENIDIEAGKNMQFTSKNVMERLNFDDIPEQKQDMT